MNQTIQRCYLLGHLLVSSVLIPNIATAQISSDGTLSTTVNSDDGVNFLIESGVRTSDNLFHSFSEFSVPSNGSAFFNNAADIVNIFSRVTGGNISNIDGLIRANGNANLFLINPAGIIFGQNASLNIGGSFFATTAESVVFGDGIEFSATEPNEAPLLTINITPGLQMGTNPGNITVVGPGYTIARENPFIVTSFTGLRVGAGNTLALIGGEITLDGGIIAADSGLIELASVREGLVNLTQTSETWQFSYEAVQSFGNVELLSLALADASGQGSGSIQVHGQNISLLGGSRMLLQNRGLQPGGTLNLTASDSVKLIGTDNNDGELGSVLLTETIARGEAPEEGKAADIVISSQHLLLSQGSGIASRTFTPARGGDITINATESIQLREFSPINPTNGSDITTSTWRAGTAGNITVSTKQLTIDGQQLRSVAVDIGDGGNITLFTEQLRVRNGGIVVSTALGSGQGGDIIINAQSTELIGFNVNNFNVSAFSTSVSGTQKAGNLIINTGRLLLQDGARVDASTFNSGVAGTITINALESVEVSGTVPGSVNGSLILSSAHVLDEVLQQQLGLPPIPSGDSGSVIINTPVLRVTDRAQVTVRNDGTGNAGALEINAGQIFLNNQAAINASTQSGEGGNIDLQITDNLLLRNGSTITTEAGGTGNGGNITINSDLVTLMEGSLINANANRGNGGNISITTQGLFVRDRAITASSEFGVDGVISINNPYTPANGLIELPTELRDRTQQIAEGCRWTDTSSFYITGRGGIPQDPSAMVRGGQILSDVRDISDLSIVRAIPQAEDRKAHTNTKAPIVEANAWIINEEGNVELVAVVNSNQALDFLRATCAIKED
ncbi:MAG: filamentous hemagglutinin N-terminal domain-containing protein [Moorea sp. SIOASIH]|uniref:two-partner secretion domain-containing protein n=1 Tax=Moorena sp. SIOASIH TaxID=2607817 RepID=UPI0013BABEF0|nr:filamentous hemagglutinin N-terminal domain-containing protein [Moorena sp. SIOASIH]NEO39932.1 filamentous hemagglutinin N-terminal domain-containing protein [Moorena sp. SIOASIH]